MRLPQFAVSKTRQISAQNPDQVGGRFALWTAFTFDPAEVPTKAARITFTRSPECVEEIGVGKARLQVPPIGAYDLRRLWHFLARKRGTY
jgi:hypothetical protein